MPIKASTPQPGTENQEPGTPAKSWLLLPASWLYAAVLAVRNWLYDRGWWRSAAGWVPLLGVGNLRVGGTGKTPHVAWLVEELLRRGQRPAILSRGYGRQTRGPRLASAADSAATVGDEPWQYFQEFGGRGVPVAVAENRQRGLDLLRQQHLKLTCVVLDDAYQHRRVRPTLHMFAHRAGPAVLPRLRAARRPPARKPRRGRPRRPGYRHQMPARPARRRPGRRRSRGAALRPARRAGAVFSL
ncbi:MAG: tetraacyldisaccharide 4'-kinase [Hymenobacter sp.]